MFLSFGHVAAVEKKNIFRYLKESSCFKRYLSINTVRNEIISYKSFFTIYGCIFETSYE